MSDTLHGKQQGSRPTSKTKRPDRQALSCTECRRRKQKCSQGQPCTNCARRFPQPICDYAFKPRGKRKGIPDDVAAQAVSKESPYAHLGLAGIQDAVLQLEMRPGGNAQTVIKELEKTLPLRQMTTTEYGSAADRLRSHYRHWLPVRLATTNQRQPGSWQPDGALQEILERYSAEDAAINAADDWLFDAARLIWEAEGKQQPQSTLQSMDAEMRHLPMVPTKLNKELLRTHLRLLSRYKACISGRPDPDHPFMKHWVPCMIQDPLLIKIIQFTSACFLNEIRHIPKSVVVALRGTVFQSLNEYLQSPQTQTTDVAILAVTEMVLDEWYWGGTQALHAHMKGLRTMVAMRGGLQDLGMHGYIAKAILINDVCMALAHETKPEIYGRPGFSFSDPIMVPYQSALNTPYLTGWPSFASMAGSLQIHVYTAQILDDMRAVFEAVLSLSDDATPEMSQGATVVASWAYGRLGELPDAVALYTPVTSIHGSDNGSPNGSSDRSSPPIEASDPVYSMVRMAALVYCRAILSRVPTSEVCSESEMYQIWGFSWKMLVSRRSTILGIYIWATLAIAPSCHAAAPARFIKTTIVNGMMTAAVANWHVAVDAAAAALRVQRWLQGSKSLKLVTGGEGAIEKHGFAVKHVLQDLTNGIAALQTESVEDQVEVQIDP